MASKPNAGPPVGARASPPARPRLADRVRSRVESGTEKARQASERHVSIAIPFRAFERNQSAAASVLAGGLAYRLFLWLLPFGLVAGAVLGLADGGGIEQALRNAGLPGVFAQAVADFAHSSESSWWWLLATGIPLLLWEGYAGAKGLKLIHALVWNDPPRRSKALRTSLLFSAGTLAFVGAIALAWWLRTSSLVGGLAVLAAMILPLAALWLLVSLWLPHGSASWKALLPGAFLVAFGFQLVHGLVVYLLGPKLEKASALYGGLGLAATLLFFMWVVGRIVVTAPILNVALYDVLERQRDAQRTPGSSNSDP